MSVPDKTIIKNGVSIIGQTNLASAVAIDASILFAKNLLSFASLMINQEDNQLVIDIADEIIKESLLTKNGEVIQIFT